MPITEEKALEILNELIKKPDSKAEEVPAIWKELISIYNTQFAPEVPVKKRRRRAAGGNAGARGWPQGVTRSEYMVWKEAQQADGVTENLNPHHYKELRDAGVLEANKPSVKTPSAGGVPSGVHLIKGGKKADKKPSKV